jgi:hypothetical protein
MLQGMNPLHIMVLSHQAMSTRAFKTPGALPSPILAVVTSRRGVRGVSGSAGGLGTGAIFRIGGALGVNIINAR